ncbi:BBT_collapsed_G0053440.mRNA.1.CDS.1 [Saccharomyces cerevisiae]|nr:BBT_collapsed_G0053440.mRNA.1.CDS.1 [Saccharomyces cerevisiae]
MGMTEPGSHNEGFGTHFDESRQRLVINSKLQCININDLMFLRFGVIHIYELLRDLRHSDSHASKI